MKRSIMQQRPDNLVVPLGITKGGTGAKTAEQARTNLDLTPVTLIGQANGIAPLSDEYKIESQYLPPADVNVISIIGWLSGSALQPMKFIITDYDFFTQYTITAQYGTVSRNEDIITYTPALGHEVQGFVANGVTYDVNVAPSYIQVPVITLPVTGSTISTNPRFIISSAFNTSGISDTHLSSTWQLSDDALFTNIIAESIDDAVNLTSWLTPQLNISTAYYVRVKYTGHILNTSDWSVVNSFTTININYPVNEVAILSEPLDIAYGYAYGTCVALSNDGTILVVGDNRGHLNTPTEVCEGLVYIYKKINTVWVLQTVFEGIENTGDVSYRFGYQVAITDDKQTIVVTATATNRYSPFILNNGKLYIYKTTIPNDYTSLELVTSMFPSSGDTYSHYGNSLSITPNAEKIAVSQYHNANQISGTYIYAFDGVTLVEEAFIPSYDQSNGYKLSSDGLTFICGQNNSESGFIYSGRLEIYNFNGLNWNLTASFTDDVVRANAWFGYPSTISNDGTMVVTTTEGIDDMSLFIYELIGGTWIRTHKIPFPPEFFMYGGEIDYILINQTKDLIALGAPYVSNSQSYPINGDWDGVGAVYIYIKINNNWVLDHTLLPNTIDINQKFGESIVMDASGSTLVVTASGAPVNSNPLYHGAVYIYE